MCCVTCHNSGLPGHDLCMPARPLPVETADCGCSFINRPTIGYFQIELLLPLSEAVQLHGTQALQVVVAVLDICADEGDRARHLVARRRVDACNSSSNGTGSSSRSSSSGGGGSGMSLCYPALPVSLPGDAQHHAAGAAALLPRTSSTCNSLYGNAAGPLQQMVCWSQCHMTWQQKKWAAVR